MANNTILDAMSGGDVIATEDIGGVKHGLTKLEFGADGTATKVSSSNPLPITGPLTDTQLRASAVPVSGPLTDTQMRASAVPVSGPLTDTQLRASAVPVSGPLTDTQLRASPLTVFGSPFDVPASITRPADTNVYAINDALADSTSAPATGGFTLSGVARVSGGGVMITDIVISSSKPANLQGTLYIFNQAVTANNDNAAFALSDSDLANLVAKIPFYLEADAANSCQHLQNLAQVALCSGSADLRFLIKLTAPYTPDNGEVIKVRAKGLRLN